MPTKRHNKTVYSEYVFTNITSRLVEGQGAYTVYDLAEMVGLKPTQNFKRRVNQMVEEGMLATYPAFSPRGGLMKIYTVPESPQMKGHPF
jgi:predicted transcriptional regulator